MSLQELTRDGQNTASASIKKATHSTYQSSFKKFAEFCIANGIPDPHHERHHELPAILVAYLQRITADSGVSLQTAEKARSAVVNFFSSHENSDGTDPNTWVVKEEESGKRRGFGNPARDPFVRQFMRGLKKRKASEYTPAKAVPISMDMLTVLHEFLNSDVGTSGFSEECRVWFKAVSSFAFFGMCRINEVLTLKWKDVTLRHFRENKLSPGELIEYGSYTLFNRKTAVAEGRSYNMHKLSVEEDAINAYVHLCNWVDFAEETKGHQWTDEDFVFPALSGVSKKVLTTEAQSTGCETVGVCWGKKMAEQVFINLLNCIVRALNNRGQKTPGYIAKNWYNNWFTSHTFRRAGAQYRFMYAKPYQRWSLRMIKWWAGWSVSESTETLVRYLLDLTIQSEESELADCLAPDKSYLHGCPSAPYEANDSVEEGPVLKRLRQVEAATLEVKAQVATLSAHIGELTAIATKLTSLVSGGLVPPTTNPTAAGISEAPPNTSFHQESTSPNPELPPANDWAHLSLMWWVADASVHLFKPLSQWTKTDRANAGVTPSWYSIARLLGEEVGMFAAVLRVDDHSVWTQRVIPVMRKYYQKHYVTAPGQSGAMSYNLTIAMIASFIRRDRKARGSMRHPAKDL